MSAKMSVQTITLLVIFIPCAWGIFDGRGDGGPRPGNQFPVTGELLQCHDAEPGVALIVGVTGNPGEVFKPTVSRYFINLIMNQEPVLSWARFSL